MSPRYRGRLEADRAAGAPILAAGAVEQTFVDEVPAQRCGVLVTSPEDQVDHLLGAPLPGLEVLYHPLQQHMALGRGDGNLCDSPVGDEVAKAPSRVLWLIVVLAARLPFERLPGGGGEHVG